jgi:hypothetical protein
MATDHQIQHLNDHLNEKHKVLSRLLDVIEKDKAKYPSYYYSDPFLDLRHDLHDVHSIPAALGVPANPPIVPYFHVSIAFDVIRSVLHDFWFRRKSGFAAARISALSRRSTQQAEGRSLTTVPNYTSSSDAKEKPNTAPQHDSSSIPEPLLPPYLGFMVKLATELGATGTKMKKVEVRDRIDERWDTGVLGERSAHKLEMMATLMRPPEAQKGRAKSKP